MHWNGNRARCSSASAGWRRSTEVRGCERHWRPCRSRRAWRATCVIHCSARVAPLGHSARRRERRRRWSRRSRRDSRRWTNSRPSQICPVRAQGVGWGPPSPRWVQSSSRVPSLCSTSSASASAFGASTSQLRVRAPSTAARSRARRPARRYGSVARKGVRCELFGGVVAQAPVGVSLHELSGDSARAAADLVELGRRLGSDGGQAGA